MLKNLPVEGKIHNHYILGCALVWDLCGGGPNRNGYKAAWDFFDPKCYILGVKTTPSQYNVFHKTSILPFEAGLEANLGRLARSTTVFVSENFISRNLMHAL